MTSSLTPEAVQPAHAYPRDLAHLVRERWRETDGLDGAPASLVNAASGLPSSPVLERLLSVCYQASLLHEEGRPVTLRISFAEPGEFALSGSPPGGLHRLMFEQTRPFDEHELRRLAPAAVFERSLIGIHLDGTGELRIWGLIHSGPRWLQAVRGGRRIVQAIPRALMVAVTGPGRVLVSKGPRTLAGLAGGTLANVATDVFGAPWFAAVFGRLQSLRQTERPGLSGPELSGMLDRGFGEKLGEHVLRRIVATIRAARHGGTLVILPLRGRELCAELRCLALKYPFSDDEPRRRILTLTVRIMNELAEVKVPASAPPAVGTGWAAYEATEDPRMNALDEALFEVAHLVATLANVDGAVVLTDQLEILGFGAEISGALPEVETVERCLDVQGDHRVSERTDRVGTRHRSAYRLCQQLRDALVVVVSQDGGVRFVCWRDGAVVYFDQIATGPWEV